MNKNNENKNEEFFFLDLDEKLAKDKDGSYKKSLLNKLTPYEQGLNSKVAKGDLAPNEFEAAKKMLEGIKKARELLQNR